MNWFGQSTHRQAPRESRDATLELPVETLPQPDETTCGPTCLHAVYTYWGDHEPLHAVIKRMRRLDSGGTYAVFLGCDALRKGYRARIYTYNLTVFDPSWFANPRIDMRERLARQQRAKHEPRIYNATEGYLEFLQLGGRIRFANLSQSLIAGILRRRLPLLTGLSSTYLYRQPREYGPTDRPDDVLGVPQGHFVVIAGWQPETRKVLVVDPYQPHRYGPALRYWLGIDRVVAAILLGIVTHDANVLVIYKRDRRTRRRAQERSPGARPGRPSRRVRRRGPGRERGAVDGRRATAADRHAPLDGSRARVRAVDAQRCRHLPRVRSSFRLPPARLVERAEHARQPAVRRRRAVRAPARRGAARAAARARACRILALRRRPPRRRARPSPCGVCDARGESSANAGRGCARAQRFPRGLRARRARPIYEAIAPHDPAGTLRREWINSRGAIARFDRSAIEIRLADTQECPRADLAVAHAISSVVQALYDEKLSSARDQRAVSTGALAALLEDAIRDGEDAMADDAFLRPLGIRDVRACTLRDAWRRVLDRTERSAAEWTAPVDVILDRGTLATRILRATRGSASPHRLHEVDGELARCLQEGALFV